MYEENIHKPWLAAGIVALMHPMNNVKNIRTWTDRNLFEWEEKRVKPGKNEPRLYSLIDVIKIKTMHALTDSAAMTVKSANAISKLVADRFIKKYEDGERDFDDIDNKFKTMLIAQNTHSNKMEALLFTKDQMVNNLKKTGMLTGGKPIGLVPVILEVDYMFMTIWNSYLEIDKEFNQLALDGKLKPFPKSLKRS